MGYQNGAPEVEFARRLLGAGNATQARAVAAKTYWSNSDRRIRKDASLLMCHADLLASQMNSARASAALAVCELEGLDDATGLAEALMLLSYACASSGLVEESRGAALRSLQLVEDTPCSRTSQAAARNYLGVAAFWAGDTGFAAKALQEAVGLAATKPTLADAFHPQVNRCFSELLAVEGRGAPTDGDLSELERLTFMLRHLHEQGPVHLNAVPAFVGRLLLEFVDSYAKACLDDREGASRSLQRLELQAKVLMPSSWMNALPWWTRSVAAERRGDVFTALNCSVKMEEKAARGEHAALAQVALQRQERLMSYRSPNDLRR